jgi:hypothetical protein
MQQQTMVQGGQPPVQALLALSGKLTIGAAVCFSEGVFTSVMTMIGTGDAYYQIGVVLTFIMWAAFFLRFRGTRIGAEITALCFADLCVWLVKFVLFLGGHDSSSLWYVLTSISMLKIMRVYLWQSSLTQQYGWGQHGLFGFVTAKKSPARWQATPWRKVALEFALLLGIAIAASIGIKLLSPLGRVLLMWLVPFAFEFILGPIQLRGLAVVATHFAASEPAAQAPLRATPAPAHEAAGTQASGDVASGDEVPVPPELIARFVAAYRNTKPVLRSHLVEYAETVGNACLEEAAEKAAKASGKQ